MALRIATEQDLIRVAAFRDAAITDGWNARPTYKIEGQDRACTLERDGFTIMLISRADATREGKMLYFASISIWGPDGLAIEPPTEYSFDEIRARVRWCSECGEKNVDTMRVGFAGRVCSKCLPAAKKKHEYPGWCD